MLCVNLIFKGFKTVKKRRPQEKPYYDIKIPKLIPISSKDLYWQEYDLNDEFIAEPNDSEDKIMVSIENKDFLQKFNSFDEGKKEKFKKEYLKHIYLLVLYYLGLLKKDKMDMNNFNKANSQKMLKSSQQTWLHTWIPK